MLILFLIFIIGPFIFICLYAVLFSNRLSGKSKTAQNVKINSVIAPEAQKMPYYLKSHVLTMNEQKLYKALKPIIDGNNLTVFPKVRLADFIYCPRTTRNFYTWFNKISAKHIDFLICDLNAKPLLAVELNDNSHDTVAGKKRDDFVDDVYYNVKLKSLYLRNYDVRELESLILGHIFPVKLGESVNN